MLRTVEVTRYVTPLREGSSLPALVEADDGAEYVVKFRGAGHGEKALVAEVLVGEIGRLLDLPVPEIVLAVLPESIARGESHDEIRDLLGWSIGLNVGLAFVPGALAADLTRTPRNANLIVAHGRSWLIDHGSALYVHHAWTDPDAHAGRAFERIADHVLLPFAGPIDEADARLAPRLEGGGLDAIIDAIPDAWLRDGRFDGAAGERDAYRRYLRGRLDARSVWVGEAERARFEVQRAAVA